MMSSGISFPEPLRAALRDGRLVVFAGAGVSMGKPASLPGFGALADLIADGTGKVRRTDELDDAFLGRLRHHGVDVHEIAARNLRTNRFGETPEPTGLHRDLLRLYPDPGAVRVVTTNLDLLFSDAAQDVFCEAPEIFRAPALPLGGSFNGIVHVHGSLDRPEEMVLTDADFGRAYLTEGWAGRFLVELFRSFTVMFVGYSHGDTVIRYLARALPVSEAGRRFILTDDADSERWPFLGITPVAYPKEAGDDHVQLSKGVRGLANDARRGLLDWRHEITEIARRPPPLDDREAAVIEEGLSDAARTRFFIDAATDPEWLEWLDRREHLDPLFAPDNLEERDLLLAGWMADNFAVSCPDVVFLLIGRHGMGLNPHVWHDLVHTIAYREDPLPDRDTLANWVSCLLATAPPPPEADAILPLARRCIRAGLDHSSIEIFDAMARHSFLLMPPFGDFEDELFGHPGLPRRKIDLELAPDGDNSVFNELWESGLKPRLATVAGTLLTSVAAHLAARHRTFIAWQRGDCDWDPDSLGRDTIGPDEQGPRFNHVDVLIDAARDCLQWLACNDPEAAAGWCAQFAASETPLLRRLCVHTLSVRNDLSACGKFDWLFANIRLDDDAAAEEVSRIMRDIYPQVDLPRRRRAVDTILAFSSAGDDDDEAEHRNVRYRLHWLRSLRDADPDCVLVRQAMDDLLIRHPECASAVEDRTGHVESWTADRLLSGAPGEWLDQLLSFRQESLRGPDRHDLLSAVAMAAQTRLEWGKDLAAALTGRELWDSDLWASLIRAWREADVDEGQIGDLFNFLAMAGVLKAQAARIADLLLAWLEDAEAPPDETSLAQANRIAVRLWRLLERDAAPEGSESWHFAATGRPAGTLARYWLRQRAMLLSHPDALPRSCVAEVRHALSAIVQDPSAAGLQGTAVLSGQIAFLLHAEVHWTRANLMPRFSQHPNTAGYWSAWDGFLTAGRLTPALGPLLKDAFLDAVPRILARVDAGRRLDRFVNLYTGMLAYFSDDPVGTWIPAFFRDANPRARLRFAGEIEAHLRHMDDARQREWWERWLRRYWTNRIEGVPRPFDAGEVALVFGWLPALKSFFPEAVDLALRMPAVPLSASPTIINLSKGEHRRESPETVARLLIHLGKEASPGPVWHSAGDLIESLLARELPEGLKKQLLELAAKLGLGVS